MRAMINAPGVGRVGAGVVAVAAAVTAFGLLTACSHQVKPGPVTYVTVTASASGSAPASPVASTAPATASATSSAAAAPASGSSAAVAQRSLPGTCDSLLSTLAVENALDRNLGGDTNFLVGVAEPDIHLLGRLDCRYGLSAPSASDPTIEILVGLYATPAAAASRAAATVQDYRAHGSSAQAETVDGAAATRLVGGHGAGYGPSVVLADGQRTVVVTLAGPLAAGGASAVDTRLDELAGLALQRTAAS